MTASLTPPVDFLELKTNQPAVAVFGICPDQLRASDTKFDPLIGPGLRDEVHRRDNLSRDSIFDDREVVRMEGRVRAGQQVMGIGSDALGIEGIITVNPAVEFGQRIGIRRCGTAHDQAIAQVTQNGWLLGEHR